MLKFSVVTPSFNQAAFLEQTLTSVLQQAGANLEYFVFDGGSTDDSVDIIKKYAPRLTYWVSEKDCGQADAIVKGWRRATGEVLAWLNSDDIYLPSALGKVQNVFDARPEVQMVVGRALMMDERGKVFSSKSSAPFNLPKIFLGGSTPGQPAIFVRRSLVTEIGFPDTRLHFAFDWEYWIRAVLFLRGERIFYLDEPLAAMRIWSETKTSKGIEKFCIEQRQVLSTLFDSGNLPLQLQSLRNESLASMYVKQAVLEWQVGRVTEARKSLRDALQISPHILRNPDVHYNNLGIRLWGYIPYPLYRKMQSVSRFFAFVSHAERNYLYEEIIRRFPIQ
jgi:glycosyltransferase involved in cell wall biosynthesis